MMTSFLVRAICSVVLGVAVLSPAQAMSLRFLADANLPTGTQFQGSDLGGLSGLAFNAATQELFAISDDKSEIQPARAYTFKVDLAPGRLVVTPIALTTLFQKDQTAFPKHSIDPEGIAFLKTGDFFVSSEGFTGQSNPRVDPAIYKISKTGHMLSALPLPDKYLPNAEGSQIKGVYDNGGLEALTLTPDQEQLFTATENPLVQDDTPADFTKAGKSRVLRYRLQGATHVVDGEFVYEVDANIKPAGASVADHGNGLTDMLALSKSELLVIERGSAVVGGGFITHVRLYKATIEMTTTDVSGIESLRGLKVIAMKKEMILDFKTIIPQLSEGFRSIDNIEGIAFGPVLPNGHQTLIFVSDNNFNAKQRTQLLAFEIVE